MLLPASAEGTSRRVRLRVASAGRRSMQEAPDAPGAGGAVEHQQRGRRFVVVR
jgi:hypothetical protein